MTHRENLMVERNGPKSLEPPQPGDRVLAYCRVSTTDQADEGWSLTEQRQKLTAYADEHGFVLAPDDVFEEAFSGAVLPRPQLDRLFQRQGEHPERGYRWILVAHGDRINRFDPASDYPLILRYELKRFGLTFFDITRPEPAGHPRAGRH